MSFENSSHITADVKLGNLLEEIQQLTNHFQNTNDALSQAIQERDQDAEKISKLKDEVDRLQEIASKSEIVTSTLTSKYKSSSSARQPSSQPTTTTTTTTISSNSKPSSSLLTQLSAGDLLAATAGNSFDDDDNEDGNSKISPQSQNFRGLQKLSQHRNQQVQSAVVALETARANSFQARLHSIDRMRGKALETVVALYKEQQENERQERIRAKQHQQQTRKSSSDHYSSSSSISSWGPRASSAFAASPMSKKHLVDSEVLDDTFRGAFAAWLHWCEGKLQSCRNNDDEYYKQQQRQQQDVHQIDEGRRGEQNNSDDDGDDLSVKRAQKQFQEILNDDGQSTIDERQRTANLFKSMLTTSQFVLFADDNNDDTDSVSSSVFRLPGLNCSNELKLCRQLFSKNQDWTVADRARDFFEKVTSTSDEGESMMMNWPMAL